MFYGTDSQTDEEDLLDHDFEEDDTMGYEEDGPWERSPLHVSTEPENYGIEKKFPHKEEEVENTFQTLFSLPQKKIPPIFRKIHHSYVMTFPSTFHTPCGIAMDPTTGVIYVADTGNNRLLKIDPAGCNPLTLSGNGTPGFRDGFGNSAQFQSPQGLARDLDGSLYVADTFAHCIRKMTTGGEVKSLAGNGVIGYKDGHHAQFNHPRGLVVDGEGNVIVADTENNKIRKILSNGFVITIAGSGIKGYADGNTLTAQFNLPYGITIDKKGTIYVADTHNHSIRRITKEGEVTTIAGNPPPQKRKGRDDGIGVEARFSFPKGITNDDFGNLYVADTENSRIRKISEDGRVGTLVGKFYHPRAVCVDGYANVIVADTENNRIKKIMPVGLIAHFWPKTHTHLNQHCKNAILEIMCITKQYTLHNDTLYLPDELIYEIVKSLIKCFYLF